MTNKAITSPAVKKKRTKQDYMKALARARQLVQKYSDGRKNMVDELIIERRAEAAREEKEARKLKPITAEHIAYLREKFSKNRNTQIVTKKSIIKKKRSSSK